mgnify:CR=1 FL=1
MENESKELLDSFFKKIRDIIIIITAGTVIYNPNIRAEELVSLSLGTKNLKYPF